MNRPGQKHRKLPSQPYRRRENFDDLPETEIPDDGLRLELITIRYGSEQANRMRIGTCEYDDESQVVDGNVLQSSAFHEAIDVRIDLHYPCTEAFIGLFVFPRTTVETTVRFLGANEKLLREHVYLAGETGINELFSYVGDIPATHITVTGGANLYLDNVDLSAFAPLIKNGDFELGDDGSWTMAYALIFEDEHAHEKYLVLTSGPEQDAFALQRITPSVAGNCLLNFTISTVYGVHPRPGAISLLSDGVERGRIEFEFEGPGPSNMSFLLEISDDEIRSDRVLQLRMAKLANHFPEPTAWRIDDVSLIPVLPMKI